MNLLMASLTRNIGPFGYDGGSNLQIKLEGKSRDLEDPENESQKEPDKEQLSSSVINP
jgi:hypothetical protein